MKRPGLTLVELLVAAALAGVVALVTAGLFKAGMQSFNYSYRQTRVVYAARQALAGDGARYGMVWAAQTAESVDGVSPSVLAVTPAGELPTTFVISGDGLYSSRLGVPELQAGSVSSLRVGYYNMGLDGRIMASTAAASASLVTVGVAMRGRSPSAGDYNFTSAAQLRNSP